MHNGHSLLQEVIAMRSSRFMSWLRVSALAATMAVSSFVGASSSIAPGFSLPSRAGDTVTLDKLKGQVVMINFWASWCGPCRTEMPLLDQMYKRYSSLGFTLIGVNVEADTKDAEKLLASMPVTFPVVFDRESKVSKMYDVNAMPSSVFIDRKGNVSESIEGILLVEEFEEKVKPLLRR